MISTPSRSASRLRTAFPTISVLALLALCGGVTQAQAQPVATATVTPAPAPLIGETLVFPVTFDNTGTTTGYGPFIDLVLPATGADGTGAAVDDGITFVSATYLGQPVTSVVLTFNGAGQATHPYAVNAAGVPLVVTGGTPGDQLVVLQLPFGSFTTTQPAAVLQVTTTLSNLADLGVPLNIRARAGFQYGADPLNNPPTDPSIVGPFTANQAVTPAIWRLTKTYVGPEDETATGPNFPRQYRIDVDIAAGQTVTNLDLIDLLPANLQYLAVVSTLVNNAPAAASAVATPSTTVPGGTLTRRFASVTGTAGTQDASLIFSYFVPRVDSATTVIIDPNSGDDATSVNDASSAGAWTPIDVRDTASTVTSNVTANDHTLTPKSIAIQKGVTIAIDTGAAGPTPGDTLEYTLSMQVSDYFAMQGLVLTDIISDGQRRAPGFVPTLAVAEHTGGILPAAGMAPANSTFVVSGTTGETTATFFVAAEQILRGADGRLAGGCVPQTGTGGPAPNCATFNGGATTVTVVYRTVIQEDFSTTFPSGDSSVDHGDVLSNSVTAVADILSTVNATTPTGQNEADTSGAGVTILSGTLTKTIYAINGNTTFPVPASLGPGDTVTYRLRYTLPSSDVEPLTITDFLPLPVLLAGEVVSPFLDVVSAAVPAAGRAKFGPDDTFRALSGLVPAITTDAAGNSVRFDYAAFDDPGNTPTQVDILFTVTTTNTPFADGLFLTNQARVQEGTTNAGQTIVDAIVQIILNEPNLRIRKGAVTSSNTADVFAPTTVGPVAFTAPGSAGNRFVGTISSNGLTATPINSNVSLNDAADIVTFAIVVENIGNGPEGAFDVVIRDTLPTGLVVPGGGPNLRVTNGAGTVLPFTDLGGGLFGAGIQLNDPSLTQGALAAYSATTGANLAVLTFDLALGGAAPANTVLTNLATLSNYAGTEGGPDFTTVDLTDPATVTTAPPTMTKVITGTNQGHTSGNNVAIGERVSYRLTIRVPEGTTPSAVLTDTLDSGLAVVSLDSITASPGLSAANGAFTDVLAAATVGATGAGAINAGRVITLNFGTLTNADIDNATSETIVLDYTVVALNAAGNNRGGLRNNAASLAYTGGTATVQAANVTFVEPTLQVVKTALPTSGDAGDLITFTVTLSHTGASNVGAFNTTLVDVLPAGLTYVSATHTGGLAPTLFTPGGGGFLAEWDSFPLASTSIFQLVASVNGGLSSGAVLINTATTTYTSLPGDVTAAQSTFNTLSTERTGNPANPGGAENDHLASGNANVTVSAAAVAKALVDTNRPHTAGNNVAVGEILTYTVTVTVPEAVSNGVTLVDTLDPGLAFVGFDSLVSSNPAAVSTAVAGGFPAVLANAVVTNPTASPETAGGRVTFNFGTVTNTDTNNAVAETLTLTYRAVVLNTAANLRGQARNNSVAWTAGGPAVIASAPDVIIVEPELQVVKTVAPANVDAGDSVTYTLVVSHAGASNADAFNAALLDTLPAGLTVTAGPTATGTAPTTLVLNAGAIEAAWTSFPIGSTTTITFTATVSPTLTPGAVVTNLSGLSWTGLPGDVTATQSTYNPLGVERTGNAGGPGGAANTYRASDPASVTINSNSLAGRVYVDADGNGLFTAGEPPIAGVVITLTGTDHLGNPVVLTTTTLADGTYLFPNLRPGTYTVRETQPAGFADGGENAGSAMGTVANDVVSAILLPVATVTDAIDYNFGELPTADLEVVKTDTPDPAQPGGTLVYTMQVRNNGPNAAANVVFRDPIPTGTAFVSIAAPGLSCTTPAPGAAGDVVCTVASLAAGASTTVTLTLQVSPTLLSGAVITNAAAVGSDTVDPRPENNRDDEPTVVAGPGTADLAITKTDAVDPVVTGADVTYTLTVQNNGPTNATNVVVTDTLPAGVTLVSATPSQGAACTGTITVSCDLGALANGASATVVVVVTTSVPGVIVNQAAVTASEPDPAPGNNQATEPTTVGNPTDADLVVTKVDAVDPVLTDAVISYRIVVENRGPSAASTVTLADVVPANTVFEGLTAPAGWVCTAPVVGAAGAISCTVATLASGATAVFEVRVRVAPGTPPGTTVSNTVTVESATPDPNPTNNTDTEPTLVVAPGSADLSIIKTDAPDAQAAGAPVSYTLTVTNHGPATATNVTVTDPLPAGTALIAASTGCSETGGLLTCTIGVLASGASTALGVTISTPPVAGVLNNIATVTATEPDPVPGNNSEPEQTTLVSVADVRIAKVGPASATAGATVSYTLTITNDGPSLAENVTVNDPTPTGLVFVSTTGACTTAFPCVLGTMLPAEVRTITVTFQVPSGYTTPNPISNTATVSTTTPGDNPLNNTSTALTPLGFGGDVEVVKTASTMTPGVGANFDYLITVRNLGPSDVTNTVITEFLPVGVTYQSHLTSSGTYVPGTALWTIPTLVAGGGSATLTLTVRADQAGPLPNTARRTGGDQPDPNPTNDEDTVTPVAVELADVAIIKTGPAQVLAGGTISYTLTIRNNGPGLAANVSVADPTPANLTFVSNTGACTTAFPCALGNLLPNEERVITATFTVGVVPNGTLVQNTATVSTTTPESNTTNNTSTVNTTVDTRVDVAVTKTVAPAQARIGQPVTFSMTATNNGPNPATGVVATDVLPAGLIFVSATPSVGTYDQTTGAWTIGNLTVGQTVSLSLVATVTVPGPITNIIVRTSQNEPDGDPSNDSGSATVNAGLYADIGVVKNAIPTAPVVGAPLTFTITARNFGRDLAPAVTVDDVLPAAVSFVSATTSVGTFDAGTGRWTIGAMVPGASATLTLTTTVVQAGPFVNTTRVTGVGVFDPNPINDEDAVVLNATTEVNLRVRKVALRPIVGIFEDAPFLVTITNDGPSPATGVEVTDQLPPGLVFVSASTSQGSYAPGSGIWSVGALAATQTATLHLTARVTTSGPIVNRATLTNVDQEDVNPNDNTDTAPIGTPATTGGVCSDVELRQSFPRLAVPGGLVPARYTAVNLGPAYAMDLEISGMIPPGVTVDSMTASAGGSCRVMDDMVICLWPGTTLIGEGTARVADVVFRVNPTTAPGTTVWGWFMTHTSNGDCNHANDMVDNYVYVDGGTGRADLQVQAAVMLPSGPVAQASMAVGEPFTVRLAVTNHGPDAGEGDYALVLSEAGALMVDSGSATGGTIAGSAPNQADWLTGPIAPGTTIYADFRVRMLRSTAVRLMATRLRGAPVDPDATNDIAEIVIDGVGAAAGGGRWIATGRTNGGPTAQIITGAGEGDRPQVRVFSGTGVDTGLRFYAFEPSFTGGVRVASCDIDADGVDEIIVGQGAGGSAVRVLRVVGGTVVEVTGFQPFEPAFTGGVSLACADLDGDLRAEVIIGAGPGRPADVRTFAVSSGGPVGAASWLAYPAGFTGGVRVAAGDHAGSAVVGAFQVLTTPGPGAPVEARAWAVGGTTATLVAGGLVYPASYTGGATAAVGDLDGDGVFDIAVAPDTGQPGLLRVMSLATGQWLADVPAGTAGFTGGIRVQAGMLTGGPGRAELVVAGGAGSAPVVQVYLLTPGGGIRRVHLVAVEVP